ncbi:MAG: alpha/beta hydrolase [Dehalococcoidales bacterium]|nr:alpha/beta hydrolase [Dehalococcoidales bacterium]
MTKETEAKANIERLKLNVNGYRTHYLKAGVGPPVLLVHGGASDSRDWLDTMNRLDHRFTFYAPDLIGFGQNERNEVGYYLSDFSDFLLGFIDTLGLEMPVLVGHSFGARVCLDVAMQNGERVGKLVLIDASGLGKVSRFGTSLLTFFWALRKLFGKPQPYPRFLVKEGDDYNHVGNDNLAKLTVPTLLVWKRLDPYIPLSNTRQAAEVIPGARLEIMPGYGHAPHQQNSEVFNRLLLEFIDGE